MGGAPPPPTPPRGGGGCAPPRPRFLLKKKLQTALSPSFYPPSAPLKFKTPFFLSLHDIKGRKIFIKTLSHLFFSSFPKAPLDLSSQLLLEVG